MGKPAAGIAWNAHQQEGECYPLNHLHPHQIEHVVPAKGSNPEKRYQIHVFYGLHCFTRKAQGDEQVPRAAWYSDSRERRVFCPERWELSKQLPEIIRTLGTRKCLHTQGEEFVTLKVTTGCGGEIDYAVFFTVSKARKAQADLNLFVNSAHERHNKLQHKKPIKFDIIVMNRMKGKRIKPPR